MKLLKTIHFDQSDTHVYAQTAGNDEWAVSGAFAFARHDKSEIKGKVKQAFSNGFLSLESFARATFTSVAEVETDEQDKLAKRLAQHFCDHYGAPSVKSALPVAEHEISYITDLCADHPINTVFTVRRFFDEAGEMREEYRTVTPPSDPIHTKVWEVVEE